MRARKAPQNVVETPSVEVQRLQANHAWLLRVSDGGRSRGAGDCAGRDIGISGGTWQLDAISYVIRSPVELDVVCRSLAC